jgi:hypothetical protein
MLRNTNSTRWGPRWPHEFTALYGHNPVTIRRTDNNDTGAFLYFNTLRDSSTKPFNWDAKAYRRPRWLKSNRVQLLPGKTVEITTPYGGPLMLDPIGSEPISLSISGAAQHAFIDDISKTAEYAEALETTELPWTQIKTPMVEIHSRTDRMREAVAREIYKGDTKAYIEDVVTFIIKNVYELAGINREDIDHSEKVLEFCTDNGWDCFNKSHSAGASKLQHINSVIHTACGAGCSGNPYDCGWAINPGGWGEHHEMGHNFQPGRLRINGGASGEVSNNIFPLRARMRYVQKYGREATDHKKDVGYKLAFEMIQDAIKAGEQPRIFYSDGGGLDERLAFYIQMFHKGSELDFLDDGWDLFTLLYVQSRLFGCAEDWGADKFKLGFSTYANKPGDISGNDFMLIALSWITEMDQRPFFDTWGVVYSDAANNQVASYGFPETENVFYLPHRESYMEPIKYRLLLDGNTPWPEDTW